MQTLTLFTAFAIAAVAAWFSVVGLSTIFAGAFWSVIIMASILEIGKLVSAVWLHLYWKSVGGLIKLYLLISVFILMVITSMGIFGYLSKAHIETKASGGEYAAQIERIEQRIDRQNTQIARANKTLDDLDAALDKYNEVGAVTKGLAAREDQKEQREVLNADIDTAYDKIDEYRDQIADINVEVRAFEVEVGPIKYVAELVYGDDAETNLSDAVRWAIILIIVVFDPLAVILLITSAKAIKEQKPKPKRKPAKKNINYIDPKDIVKVDPI
jgi:hypothetical protein